MGTIGKINPKHNNYIYLVRRAGNDSMDLFTENRPETCSSVGLDCSTCIQRCASTTAAICPDLQPAGVHRIFFQVYSSPACHPMAHAFMRAYDDAATPKKPLVVAARANATAAAAA
jgi:hypothetical protein